MLYDISSPCGSKSQLISKGQLAFMFWEPLTLAEFIWAKNGLNPLNYFHHLQKSDCKFKMKLNPPSFCKTLWKEASRSQLYTHPGFLCQSSKLWLLSLCHSNIQQTLCVGKYGSSPGFWRWTVSCPHRDVCILTMKISCLRSNGRSVYTEANVTKSARRTILQYLSPCLELLRLL